MEIKKSQQEKHNLKMGEVNEEFKAIMARFNANPKDCSGLGNNQTPSIGKPPTVPASSKPRPTVSTIQTSKYSSDSGHSSRLHVPVKLDSANGPFKQNKGISPVQNVLTPLAPKGPGVPRIYRPETKDSGSAGVDSSSAAQPIPTVRSIVAQKSLFEGKLLNEPMMTETGFKTKDEHVQDNIKWNISQALMKPEKNRDFPGNRFRPPLEEQKNVSENMDSCVPKRKALPSDLALCQKPVKPKRPPNVDLEKFRKVRSKALSGHPITGKLTGCPNLKIPKPLLPQPNSRPRFTPQPLERTPRDLPSVSNEDEEDMYDDAETIRPEKHFFPPPPPPILPPKPGNLGEDSLSELGSSTGEKDSDGDDSEYYEEVERVDKDSKRPPKTDKKSRELKEQKERQKKEHDSRKKFKLNEPIEVIHTAKVNKDSRGGKLDLCVKQGDSVEIVRINDNPEGKWLARTSDGTLGYINNTYVDVDYDAVKRKLLNNTKARDTPRLHQTQDEDFYDDVGLTGDFSRLNIRHEDVYDDVDPVTEDFPPPPPELRMPINPRVSVKKSKKEEKEEKELRKKFKFEGEIKVLSKMMVDPNANTKKGGGKDLQLVRGEILDVIQYTCSEKYLCRNASGKYGYAPKSLLLEPEWEIYDDIDHNEIYDND